MAASGASGPDSSFIRRTSGGAPGVAAGISLAVVVAGGLAGATEARSLLVVGAMLLGWSQLVSP
jgi:hypothetical protein